VGVRRDERGGASCHSLPQGVEDQSTLERADGVEVVDEQ
jgi:hypothetical protein